MYTIVHIVDLQSFVGANGDMVQQLIFQRKWGGLKRIVIFDRYIFFDDDFTVNHQRVSSICEGLKNRNLK